MRFRHVAPSVLFVTSPRFPTDFLRTDLQAFTRGRVSRVFLGDVFQHFLHLTAAHTVSGGSRRGFNSRSATDTDGAAAE